MGRYSDEFFGFNNRLDFSRIDNPQVLRQELETLLQPHPEQSKMALEEFDEAWIHHKAEEIVEKYTLSPQKLTSLRKKRLAEVKRATTKKPPAKKVAAAKVAVANP